MIDHYLVLGVQPDASPEVIRARFRFLAQAFHPDKYRTPEQKQLADEEFKKINTAYQILSDPLERAKYDLQRKSTANYSRTNDTSRKAEEAARQRAQEEQRKKAEEVARQREREEQSRKAEEARYQQVQLINKGKIVAIHSFSSGNGKSIITANLAAQVAMAGKRVGVVDTDILSPGIHLHFGLDETKIGKTINDFLHDKATIREIGFLIGENAAGAEGRAKLAGKDLWLFPSSIRGREITQILREGVDFNKLNEGLQTTMSEFNLDYLFIDTHPGLNEETLLSIATSDILVIILRPDNEGLQGASITVDQARSLEVPNLLLMVNKALPKYDLVEIKKELETKFNTPVAGILPFSVDLDENASSDLFSLLYPDHDWSKGLRGVVEAILKIK